MIDGNLKLVHEVYLSLRASSILLALIITLFFMLILVDGQSSILGQKYSGPQDLKRCRKRGQRYTEAN